MYKCDNPCGDDNFSEKYFFNTITLFLSYNGYNINILGYFLFWGGENRIVLYYLFFGGFICYFSIKFIIHSLYIIQYYTQSSVIHFFHGKNNEISFLLCIKSWKK